MFTPVKEFKHDGYYYDDNADTHVLEYLYPIANYYCPDFSGEYNEEGLPIYEPTQAVRNFVIRYNYKGKSSENKVSISNKSLKSIAELEKRKQKIDEYQKEVKRNRSNSKEAMTIQEFINYYELDSEKFWYLFLFISDYVEGLCIHNAVVTESPIKQIERFIKPILENVDEEKKILELMRLEVKIGKKHSVKLNNTLAIHYIASAIEYLKDNLYEIDTRIAYSRVNWSVPEPQNLGITIAAFARVFIQFFNSKETIVGKRKGGEVSNNELQFIELLFNLSELYVFNSANPEQYIREQLKRNSHSPNNIKNNYY